MYSMLVIGLGRFGANLAQRLAELGNEVMVIDRDESAVDPVAPLVTASQIGDCMDIDVLREIGADNFDVCFVCISDDFQASMEITSLLKEAGARWVVSKADREIHAKFLSKIGADAIIHPERDMALRAAVRYSAGNAFDYIELTDEYAIYEMSTPRDWVGHSLKELEVRSRYGVNVLGVKEGEHVRPITRADRSFEKDEHILVAGSKRDLLRVMDL